MSHPPRIAALVAILLGLTATARADEPGEVGPAPPKIMLAAATLREAVIDGDWAATRPAAPGAHFPGWPTSADSDANLPLRYFFSGSLLIPRQAPEIAFYNPWLDAAILTRWQPRDDDSAPAVLLAVELLPSTEADPIRWLNTPENPLVSLPAAVRDFDRSWREKGLALAAAKATPAALLDRAGLHLGLLAEAHRLLAENHPALHQALAERRIESWVARLPAGSDPLRDRLLALPPVIRDHLVLGAAIPLDEHGRHLLALWPENAPRIAVLLLYDPRSAGGLTDLVFTDLNNLADNTP